MPSAGTDPLQEKNSGKINGTGQHQEENQGNNGGIFIDLLQVQLRRNGRYNPQEYNQQDARSSQEQH